MASTKPITAIVERLKAKAKPPNKTDYEWIKFTKAAAEIQEAFGTCPEAAQMTLFGLIATGQVRALDKAEQFIDLDDCTIAELEGKPKFVRADQLRDLLREWSPVPTADRDRVIAEKLRSNQIPGGNTPWKKFCDEVRDKCNGWRAKGEPEWGFSQKQIHRSVNKLMGK
jgi:hypothetical protein